MKHFIVFCAACLLIVGCNNKKKEAAQASNTLTEVAPPAPTHNATGPQPVGFSPVQPAVTEPPPVETAPAAASGKTYTVKRGDTLWGIAKTQYGDGKQYKKIVAANPSIKGEQVNAGQKLVLP